MGCQFSTSQALEKLGRLGEAGPVFGFGLGLGTTQQKALTEVHSCSLDQHQLPGSLDALGHHLGAHVLAQPDHRFQQQELTRALLDAGDQLAIQLDDIRIEIRDVLDVGEAGAKIIDGQAQSLSCAARPRR